MIPGEVHREIENLVAAVKKVVRLRKESDQAESDLALARERLNTEILKALGQPSGGRR